MRKHYWYEITYRYKPPKLDKSFIWETTLVACDMTEAVLELEYKLSGKVDVITIKNKGVKYIG